MRNRNKIVCVERKKQKMFSVYKSNVKYVVLDFLFSSYASSVSSVRKFVIKY